jgi:hypothetical protein
MKKFLTILTGFALVMISCNKNGGGYNLPPGNPNHEVKAMVSIKGAAATSFTATGNYTSFSKTTMSNGDIILVVLGSASQGTITLNLVNINSAGTYTIGGSGSQYVTGQFAIGNPLFGAYEIFFAPAPPPAAGTLTLDELTATSYRGSFSMTCTGSTGTIIVSGGTFKGTY